MQIDHNGVVKLCDFGLARVMGKESSNSSENSRAGTPVYLAPEALQGAPTTNKVDVYRYFPQPCFFRSSKLLCLSLTGKVRYNHLSDQPAMLPQFLYHCLGNDDWPASMGDLGLQADGGCRPPRPQTVDNYGPACSPLATLQASTQIN